MAFKKGNKPWNKGIKTPQNSGEKNGNWKGDNVKYRGLHMWVRKVLGIPQICEFCDKKRTTPKSIQWANKSGKYLRDEKDWISLCVPCHRRYDFNKLKTNI